MAIRVKCGYCAHPYLLADEFEGKNVVCKKCGQSFQAVAFLGEAQSGAVSRKPPPPKPAAKPVAGPRRVEAEIPARRPRSSGAIEVRRAGPTDARGIQLWIAAAIGGMVALGSVLLLVFWLRSADQPQNPIALEIRPVVVTKPANAKEANPIPAPAPRPKNIDPPIRPVEPPPPAIKPVEPAFTEPAPNPPLKADPPPDFRRKGAWRLEPDPGPDLTASNVDYKKAVFPVLGIPHFVAPTTPSEFLAIRHNHLGREAVQVVNLRTYKQDGGINGKLEMNEEMLSPDGKFLVGQQRKGLELTINVLSFAAAKYVRSFAFAKQNAILRSYDFGPPNHLLTVVDDLEARQAKFRVMNVATGQLVKEFLAPEQARLGNKQWALSPGRRFVAISSIQRVTFFDVMKGKIAGEIILGNGIRNPLAMAFSHDGQEFAMICGKPFGGDRLITLKVANGDIVVDHEFEKQLKTAEGVRNRVSLDLQWLPDGSGWWVGNSAWIDRLSGAVVYTTPEIPRESHHESPRRIVGSDLTVLVGGNFSYSLVIFRLPTEPIADSVKTAREGIVEKRPIPLPAELAREEDPDRPGLTPIDVATMKVLPPPLGDAAWRAKPEPTVSSKSVQSQIPLRSRPDATDAIAFSSGASPQAFVFNHHMPDPTSKKSIIRVDRYDMATAQLLGAVDLFPAPVHEESPTPGFNKKRDARPFLYRGLVPLEVSISLDASRFLAFPKEAPESLDVWTVDGRHVAAWKPGEKEEANVEEAHLIDNDHVLTRTETGKVSLWRLPECRAIYEMNGVQGPLELSAGRTTVFAMVDGSPELFDAMTGDRLGTLERPPSGPVTGIQSIAFSPDGKHLAAIAHLGNAAYLVKWSVADGKAIGDIRVPPRTDGVLHWAGNDHQLFGDDLYDWNFRGVLWHYALAQQGNSAITRRGSDGRRWFQGFSLGNRSVNLLIGAELPDLEARRHVALIAKGGLTPAYPPGTKVKLDVLAAVGSVLIRQDLEKSLLAKGYELGEGGLVVTITANEEPTGKTIQVRTLSNGPGKKQIVVPIQDRFLVCESIVTDAQGKQIAKFQSKFSAPRIVPSFKTDDYESEISERMAATARVYFVSSLQLNKYYRVDGMVLTYPRVSLLKAD